MWVILTSYQLQTLLIIESMLLLRITVLEFSALLQHSIALYCVLPDSKLPLITPKYIDLLITYIRIFNYITIIPPNCGKNHLEYIGTIYLSIFTIHLCRITVFLILKEIGSLKRNESYLLHCFWQERKWITRSYIYI